VQKVTFYGALALLPIIQERTDHIWSLCSRLLCAFTLWPVRSSFPCSIAATRTTDHWKIGADYYCARRLPKNMVPFELMLGLWSRASLGVEGVFMSCWSLGQLVIHNNSNLE